MPPLAIEYVRVADLLTYERNPRTHSPEQVAQLASMIREVGFLVPVLLDDQGILIAGHGRREAALKLGLEEVPAIRAAHLSPAQVRAMRVADNQLAANAGYDLQALSSEVAALAKEGFNLEALGFSDNYLRALTDGNNRALEAAARAQDTALMRSPPADNDRDSDGGTGGDPGEDRYRSQFGCIVVCASEAEQARVYEELKAHGYVVKVVVT